MTATAATRADVEALLMRDLSAYDTAITRLLELAEGTLAADMPGLTFGPASSTVTVEGDGDEVLVLPYYPVRAVTSVAIAGVELDADAYRCDVLGRLRRRYDGAANPHDDTGGLICWPDAGVDIVVTYDYGFVASAMPPEMTTVVAELVSRRVVNPTGASQQSIGDRSESFAGAAGVDGGALADAHRNLLRHWRRNRYASARVRS